MPKSENLDISRGSVLHIKGFSTRGHPPKNKFCLILGKETPSGEVLAFLISSQSQYAEQSAYRNEIVTIARDAVHFLSQVSFVQCFTLERLDHEKLTNGFESGVVEHRGKLSKKYLYRIKETVKNSNLLTQQDIDAAIRVLALPEQKQQHTIKRLPSRR